MSTDRPVLHRTFAAELTAGEGRTIEGCCVPYGEAAQVRDGSGPAYHEVFEPGAFRRQLRAANRIGLRFEHREEIFHRLGQCQELEDTAAGLMGSFRVFPGQSGDTALEMVRSGMLAGFSVGFSDRLADWRRTPEGTVVRSSCELHEVSLTETPAYATATVTGIRSRQELRSVTGLELPEPDAEQRERLRAVGIDV